MNLFMVAGALMLVGGLGGVWGSAQSRRRGDPWRGDGLTSLAMTLYGALILAGVVFNGTVMGVVIVWTFAAATFAGLWIARREQRMTSR